MRGLVSILLASVVLVFVTGGALAQMACGDAKAGLQNVQDACRTQGQSCGDVPAYQQAVASSCGVPAPPPARKKVAAQTPNSAPPTPKLPPQSTPQPLSADALPKSCGYFTKPRVNASQTRINSYAEGSVICFKGVMYICTGEDKQWIAKGGCPYAHDPAFQAENFERSQFKTNVYEGDEDDNSSDPGE